MPGHHPADDGEWPPYESIDAGRSGPHPIDSVNWPWMLLIFLLGLAAGLLLN